MGGLCPSNVWGCATTRKTQQGNNGLCRICQRVPFRVIFKLLQGDASVRSSLLWFPTSQQHGNDNLSKRVEIIDERPFVKWHNNISDLRDGCEQCPFCRIILRALQKSYHYKSHVKPNERRHLWLQLPFIGGNPLLTVYIGDSSPEVRISGNYRFTTTPGKA
jgi:hypothetical protein